MKIRIQMVKTQVGVVENCGVIVKGLREMN